MVYRYVKSRESGFFLCYNFRMRSFDLKDLFSKSWQIYKRHFFAITVIYLAVFAILAFVRQFAKEVFVLQGYAMVLFKLVVIFLQIFLSMGIVYMVLKIDKNRAPSMSDFFRKLDRFFSFALLMVALSVMFYLGLYFLIVPAFFVILFFAFAPYAFLDKDMGIFRSMLYSFQISKGYWYKLSFFWFLIIAMNVLASLFVLPVIFAVPLSSIAVARLYLALSCLRDRQNECSIKLAQTEPYQKIIAILFVFSLAFYGSWLFFQKTLLARNATYNDMSQNSAISTQDAQALDELKLAVELLKEQNGQCPSVFEIEKLLDKEFDRAHFSYEVSPNICRLCAINYNICLDI